MLQLPDNRMERTVRVVRGALVLDLEVGDIEAIAQGLADARFADAGFTAQQCDVTLTTLAALPQTQQLPKLMLPADEPRQGARALGIETAVDNALADKALGQYRLCKPLELVSLDIIVDKY